MKIEAKNGARVIMTGLTITPETLTEDMVFDNVDALVTMNDINKGEDKDKVDKKHQNDINIIIR